MLFFLNISSLKKHLFQKYKITIIIKEIFLFLNRTQILLNARFLKKMDKQKRVTHKATERKKVIRMAAPLGARTQMDAPAKLKDMRRQ